MKLSSLWQRFILVSLTNLFLELIFGEIEASEDSDYVDFLDEDENEEYDSDVHGAVRLLRKEKRANKIKNKEKKTFSISYLDNYLLV